LTPTKYAIEVDFTINSFLYLSNDNKEEKREEEDEHICIGSDDGQIHLFKLDKQMNKLKTLYQILSSEHKRSHSITSIIMFNESTIISAYDSYSAFPDSYYNAIIVWSKSKSFFSIFSSSSSSFKPRQIITRKELTLTLTRENGVSKLVKLNDSEFAASTTSFILIWTRGKREEEENFQLKQKIITGGSRYFSNPLLFISKTYELVCGGFSIEIFQSTTSSLLEKRQDLKCSSSSLKSLIELNPTTNNNDSSSSSSKENRVEFASGHSNGEIKIWSKLISSSSSSYSLLRKLQPYKSDVSDLLFLKEFNCLIACFRKENKILVIHRNRKEEEEELEHKDVRCLIELRNGAFASGGGWNEEEESFGIWEPRFT